MTVELSGNFGNKVYLKDGNVVEKHFQEHPFSVTPAKVRRQREIAGLKSFAPKGLAPKLLGINGPALLIEYIEGESLQEKQKRGEDVLMEVGAVLNSIHQATDKKVDLQLDFTKRAEIGLAKSKKLLSYLGFIPKLRVNWQKVNEAGVAAIHGDFYLSNLIQNCQGIKVIDWEYHRLHTPYTDFAAVKMWILDQFGGAERFWQGYGWIPDEEILQQFIKLEALEFLSNIDLDYYKKEDQQGLYHQMVNRLKE